MSSTTKQLRGFYDRKGVKWNLPTEAGTEVPSVEIAEIEQSLVGKVDVIEDPALAAGNFASINSKGGIANSGKKASDFLPATPIDTTPTANSDNLVTSGGVKDALDGKQNTLTFDAIPTDSSTNPVTSGGVNAALNGKADVNHSHNVSEITGMDTALKSKIQDGDNLIQVSGDDTDGEIIINMRSEGDEGEGEDNEFYIGVDKLNDILHPATTPTSGSSKLITSGGVFAALAGLFPRIVSTLPAASGAAVGDEYLYVGQSGVSRQFGQTYQCQEKYKADCTLNSSTQDEQEKSGVLNRCKTLRSVTGGKYIMRSYSESGDNYSVNLDVYPNSLSVSLSDLYAAIVTDIESNVQRASINVDDHSDQSASNRKEWVAKFSQEIVPVY